ncbi:LPS translocon maturation chaperone LptM [Alysiella filiformis]|uniref:LPS translocon maturation chaperone LptM n=1 Tax=Alysiella filiformis TaxID=194196 RepID=UPI001177AE9C|nr:lipoprotein [Alysiella filiformis]QMT32119.1 lipoprotein [Alysiella filiformis]UBQ56968.1 lipoprotein [Alysiella filiformis DSM 16848]
MKKIFLLINVLILSACGFKGDLYLPKENDKNQFGIIQTGLETQSTQPQTETKP